MLVEDIVKSEMVRVEELLINFTQANIKKPNSLGKNYCDIRGVWIKATNTHMKFLNKKHLREKIRIILISLKYILMHYMRDFIQNVILFKNLLMKKFLFIKNQNETNFPGKMLMLMSNQFAKPIFK